MATDRNLQLNITATVSGQTQVDSLNQSLVNTERAASSVTSGMTGLKRAAEAFLAVLAVGKIRDFITETIRLSNEQEKADIQLRQAAISAGRNGDAWLAMAKKQASAFQQITAFGDEATEAGMRFLATNREITEKNLPAATRAMLDYATYTRKSVEESGKMINAVLAGNGRGLRELGINMTAAEWQHLDFAKKLETLNAKIGGQAEAFGKTYAGQVARLGNAWGDAKEKIGDFFKSVFQSSGILEDLIKAVQKLDDKFKQFNTSGEAKKYGDTLKNIFDPVIEVINFLSDHLTGVTVALKTFVEIIAFAGSVALVAFIASLNIAAASVAVLGTGIALILGLNIADYMLDTGRAASKATEDLSTFEQTCLSLNKALEAVAGSLGYVWLHWTDIIIREILRAQLAVSEGINYLIDKMNTLLQTAYSVSKQAASVLPQSIQNMFNIQGPVPQIPKIDTAQMAQTFQVYKRWLKDEWTSFQTPAFVPETGISGRAIGMRAQTKAQADAQQANEKAQADAQQANEKVAAAAIDALKAYERAHKEISDHMHKLNMDDVEYAIQKVREETAEKIKLYKAAGRDYTEVLLWRDQAEAEITKNRAKEVEKAQAEALKMFSDENAKNEKIYFDNILKGTQDIEGLTDSWKEFDAILAHTADAEYLQKLTDRAWDLSTAIADITIKNRTDAGFFPSEATINAYALKSKAAIRSVQAEAVRLKIQNPSLGVLIDETTAAKIKQINQDTTDKVYSGWKTLGDNISNTLGDSLKEFLDTANVDLGKLGESFIDTFNQAIADMIKEQWIKPMINNAMTQLRAMATQAKAETSAATAEGGQAGATSATSGFSLGGALGAIGIAMGMNEQAKAGTMNASKGALAGAAAGSLVMPGLGTVVGMMAGAIWGGVKQKAEDEFHVPDISVVWKVVDGQIKQVENLWFSSSYSVEAMNSAKKALQAQVDFFNQIAQMAGNASQGFTSGGYHITSAAGISQTTTGLQGLVANLTNFQQVFGKQFTKDFQNIFIDTFRDTLGAQFDAEDELKLILAQSDPKKREAQFQQWLQTTTYYISGDHNKKTYVTYSQFISSEDQKAIEAFFEDLQVRAQKIYEYFAPSVADAMQKGLDSPFNFKQFNDTLRQNLGTTVKQGIQQGILNTQIMPKVLSAFQEQSVTKTGWTNEQITTVTRPALVDLMDQYLAGTLKPLEGKDPLQTLQFYIQQMGADLTTSMTALEPVFQTLTEAMNAVDDSLGSTNEQLAANTKAILGPVESFLNDLTYGQFAPATSTAQIMQHASELFNAAAANSENFTQYADFMTNSVLPYITSTSSNYQDLMMIIKQQVEGAAINEPGNFQTMTDFFTNTLFPNVEKAGTDYTNLIEGIKAQVTGLPWYLEAQQVSAQDVAKMNANAIGDVLLPAIQELSDNVKRGGSFTSSSAVNTTTSRSLVSSIRNDSDVRRELKKAVG